MAVQSAQGSGHSSRRSCRCGVVGGRRESAGLRGWPRWSRWAEGAAASWCRNRTGLGSIAAHGLGAAQGSRPTSHACPTRLYSAPAPAVNDFWATMSQDDDADVPVLPAASRRARCAAGGGRRNAHPAGPSVDNHAMRGMPQVEADKLYGLVVPAATLRSRFWPSFKTTAIEAPALSREGKEEARRGQRHLAVGSHRRNSPSYVKREIGRWGKGSPQPASRSQ